MGDDPHETRWHKALRAPCDTRHRCYSASLALRLAAAWFALALPQLGGAQAIEHVDTLGALASPNELAALAKILPSEQPLRWTLYVPPSDAPRGVLVFVNPSDEGEPPAEWIAALAQRQMIWVAAQDFGNSKPSAQRVLAAVMGLTHVRRTYAVDPQRIYIAGMSGGGRVASQAITKLPQLFSGAMYIVGADSWSKSDAQLRPQFATKRYVFVTGHHDFNRREMQRVHRRYQRAGIDATLLLDLPSLGHAFPSADTLLRALDYLDSGIDPGIENDPTRADPGTRQ